ncbi:hypothetical protein PG993_011406 [Apiospora rasikravindrae]|uniref:SET domain-containing protein n=1 Tax=Apiospora rasikravindrae TaxID=990691 RepID=A0ABR1SE76_9PEZI
MASANSSQASISSELLSWITHEHAELVNHIELCSGTPSKSRLISRPWLEDQFSKGDIFGLMTAPITSGSDEERILRPSWLQQMAYFGPCETKLENLRQVSLNQLKVNRPVLESMIVIRTFTDPNFDRYLCAAVEDIKGVVDCIVLQNRDISLTPEEILPKGIVFAVKEPFYFTFPGGQHGILVEHPSNLFELDISDNLYPARWRREVIAQYPNGARQLQAEGNRAFVEKKFADAIRLWEIAISLCTPNEKSWERTILRNLALANLSLGRFQQALVDARAALPDTDAMEDEFDEKEKTLHSSAMFRAGLALYGLRQFRAALARFEQALSLNPQTPLFSRGRDRASQRIRERDEAAYDFEAISASITPGNPHADVADFFRNIKSVEIDPNCGYGLRATKHIAMGDIVMCEKAFVASFEGKDSAAPFATWLGRTAITNRLGAHLPNYRPDILDLGNGSPAMWSGQLVDGRPAIDCFAAHRAVYNCAYTMDALHSRDTHFDFEKWDKQRLKHSGLWRMISMMNHACDANSVRSYLGDFMIIRAAKNIKEGDEITMAYNNSRVVHADAMKLQADLESKYAFRCQCAVCKADEQCPRDLLTTRSDIYAKFYADFKLYLASSSSMPSPQTGVFTPPPGASLSPNHHHPELGRFEKYHHFMKKTYPEEVYGNLRPELCLVDFACAKVCNDEIKTRPNVLLKWALRCLRDSGLRLAIDEAQEKLTWDTMAGAVPMEFNVEAALYVCMAYKRLGKRTLAQRFRELAELLWVIYTGTPIGFKDKFHDPDIWI